MNGLENNRVLMIATIDEKNPPKVLKDLWDSGYTVKILPISGMFPSRNIRVRLKKLFGMDVRRDVQVRKKSLEKEIMDAVDAFEPAIVYEVNCMRISAACAEYIRSKCFLCAELIDRVRFFPEYYEEDTFSHYDAIYTYSREDYEMIDAANHNCVFIPALANHAIYHKIDCEKDIDVSFVGRMYPARDYGYRLKMLQRLVKDLPDANIYVGGACAPIRRPDKYIPWVTNKAYKKVFINRNISQVECNKIYNRSKISLSMERTGTGSFWSGRLTNLFATGTFVLSSDEGEMTKKYFGGGMEFFSSYEEMIQKIRYYLSHEKEREEIAMVGREKLAQLSQGEFSKTIVDDLTARIISEKGAVDEGN